MLERHSHTLERLRLDYYPFYDDRNPQYMHQWLRIVAISGGLQGFCYYPSFRDFEKLTHLAIEFNRIDDFSSCFPASLESLTITRCDFNNLANLGVLQDLLQLKNDACPVIDSITVSGYEETNEGLLDARERASSLGMLVQLSTDGHTLIILGVGFNMQIQWFGPLVSDGPGLAQGTRCRPVWPEEFPPEEGIDYDEQPL